MPQRAHGFMRVCACVHIPTLLEAKVKKPPVLLSMEGF